MSHAWDLSHSGRVQARLLLSDVDAKSCKVPFHGGEVRHVAPTHGCQLWLLVGLVLVGSWRAVLAGSFSRLEARVVANWSLSAPLSFATWGPAPSMLVTPSVHWGTVLIRI